MDPTKKAGNVAPEVDADAHVVSEMMAVGGSNLQRKTLYRCPLRPEDIPPLFVTIPEETVEKARDCIAKYNITGIHCVSDVAHKIHMETLVGRQKPLNQNTTLYIAQVCWP